VDFPPGLANNSDFHPIQYGYKLHATCKAFRRMTTKALLAMKHASFVSGHWVSGLRDYQLHLSFTLIF
jgi:hypothetical protein